jgi:gamma-butyrobetaine dioxygenase
MPNAHPHLSQAHPLDLIADVFASAGSAEYLGEPVSVRLHVAAKRYLCGTDPAYFGLLSQASVRTLELQGGPMTADEALEFAARPHAADAVAVRRWDDQAKEPAADPPGFGHFRPLLESLLLPA